jgi:hypothetical protein
VVDLLRPLRALAPRRGNREKLPAAARTRSEAAVEVEWVVSVDSTVDRAHQHAAGARKEPSLADRKRG